MMKLDDITAFVAFVEAGSISRLEQHRGIFYTNRGVADWRFVGDGGARVVRGRTGLRVTNGDMMRDAAVAGLGIALLASFVAGAAIEAGALTVIEGGAEAETEFIYVAHPEGRRPSAKLRALADCLRATFGDPPYWDQINGAGETAARRGSPPARPAA